MKIKSLSVTVSLFFLLVGGGKAQTPGESLGPQLTRRIQMEVRDRYSVSQQVDILVSAAQASDVPGFDKIVVTFAHQDKKTTFDFLISKDRKTLARLEKIDISQDKMAKIGLTGRPVRGSQDAKVTIVSYDDFQCPWCSRMHATLFPGILKMYGDRVKIVYKDYPLTEMHPWALHAAVDANCLAAQSGEAYWDFADYVHANQKVISGHGLEEAFTNLDKAASDQAVKHHLDVASAQACAKKQDQTAVQASIAEAESIGVDSTPTLFINGEKIASAMTESQMRAILDRALADAGQQPPAVTAKTEAGTHAQ